MPWQSLLVLVLVFVGIGASIGAAYARQQRQWADYRNTRDALPKMKASAWALSRIFASKTVLVVLAVVGLVVYGLIT